MKRLLSTEATESIAAFFMGGVPASIVSFQLFGDIVMPMMLAGLTGLIGGGFALLGKDLYKWAKSKVFK